MARTNKQWIARQKAQQEKQRKLMWEWSTAQAEWEKLVNNYTNPLWRTTKWFLRWSKWVNDETSWREDPDGFRVKRKAWWWEVERFLNITGFDFKRYRKKSRRLR